MTSSPEYITGAPMNRAWKHTVAERIAGDPEFAKALPGEAASLLEAGETATASIVLRELEGAKMGDDFHGEPPDVLTLTRRESLRLLEMLENPPPRTQRFLEAQARLSSQRASLDSPQAGQGDPCYGPVFPEALGARAEDQ